MAVIDVNTDQDFVMPTLISDLLHASLFFERVGNHSKTEVTYAFDGFAGEDLKFVFTGKFDKAGEEGRIDQIEIFDHGKSLVEIKQIDFDLGFLTQTHTLSLAPMMALFGVTKDLVYNGGRGRDIVMAYGGELHGGRSDDAFFSLGITHYDGGSGLDLVTYYGDENLKMKKGVTVSLADPSLNTGEATGDTYNSIEKVVGTKGHDTLYGNNGANTLVGMEGNDTLIGGKGKDTLDGGNGVDMASYETAGTTTGLGVIASLANQGSNQGDAKGDIYIGIEGLIGSSNKDILTGDANANVIKGGAGDDLIDGGLGEDELWGDSEVFGVDGADTFAINGLNTGVKTIMDFDVFDMIKIDRAGFGLAEGYQLIDGMTYIVGENATAQTEHWTFLFDTKNNQLYFDEDGNGAGEAVLLAKVNFHSQQYLDTHDFLFV